MFISEGNMRHRIAAHIPNATVPFSENRGQIGGVSLQNPTIDGARIIEYSGNWEMKKTLIARHRRDLEIQNGEIFTTEARRRGEKTEQVIG